MAAQAHPRWRRRAPCWCCVQSSWGGNACASVSKRCSYKREQRRAARRRASLSVSDAQRATRALAGLLGVLQGVASGQGGCVFCARTSHADGLGDALQQDIAHGGAAHERAPLLHDVACPVARVQRRGHRRLEPARRILQRGCVGGRSASAAPAPATAAPFPAPPAPRRPLPRACRPRAAGPARSGTSLLRSAPWPAGWPCPAQQCQAQSRAPATRASECVG